jgi:hypothetical protein
VVGRDGVLLEGFASRRTVGWSEIERMEREKKSVMLGDSIEILVLVGAKGRRLAMLPASIEGFEGMCDVIAARSAAARGQETYRPQEDQGRQQAKAARRMRWVAILFGLFTVGMAAGLVAGIWDELHTRRYDTQGIKTPARITRRYKVSVTPRVEYVFTDAAGKEHKNEMMMADDAWDALEGQKTVEVEYLPSDPDWNRLVSGRSEDEPNFGGKFLLVTSGGLLMFGTCFVLTAMGWDLKTESGKTLLVRRGRVIRQWGKGPRGADAGELQAVMLDDAPAAAMPLTATPMLAMPVISEERGTGRGLVTLGVICIVFGVIGAGLAGIRWLVASQGSITLPNGASIVTAVSAWRYIWNAIDGLLGMMLAVTGIELVRLRWDGRMLGIAVGLLQIASSIVGLIVTIHTIATAPEVAGADAQMTLVSNAGAVVGVLLGVVFPVVLVAILARRGVREMLSR